jgi:putative effector of murein hydrolase LrgA (UPF0299 family)
MPEPTVLNVLTRTIHSNEKHVRHITRSMSIFIIFIIPISIDIMPFQDMLSDFIWVPRWYLLISAGIVSIATYVSDHILYEIEKDLNKKRNGIYILISTIVSLMIVFYTSSYFFNHTMVKNDGCNGVALENTLNFI